MKAATATSKLPIGQWRIEDRPTEKLQRLGTDSLTDAELLAILIGSGTQHHSAVDIAKNVMDKFNDLNTLSKARFDEFENIEGVGTQTACKIIAAVELGKRRQAATAGLRPNMSTAISIYNHMLPKMQDLSHEEFWVLLMNQNYKLLKAERISIGGITETYADIRIIMREVLLNNATILAVCHNHPSGCLTPSREDDTLTNAIRNACSVMRVHFLDHVIVTDGAYYSYKKHGMI